MPVPADQDGNPMDPVATGTDRTYSFDLPEASAGSYWYHPHPHGKTAEQVYRGLAGAFVVKPKADPIPAAYGDTVLVFTDLRLAADGTLPDNTMTDLMNGRVGDHDGSIRCWSSRLQPGVLQLCPGFCNCAGVLEL